MKVLINLQFSGHVEVDTVTQQVEWFVTEVNDWDDPWVTVKDGDEVLADDHVSELPKDGDLNGPEQVVYIQARDLLCKQGFFPPYHANDAAVVAYTRQYREERKASLIAMIEGGNTHAISTLKAEYGIDVKLRVEVVGEAA